MALVIVLAGGGTGGHIFPALALADTIARSEPDVEIRFVGTERGLEGRYVPAAGYTLDFVPSRPVLGRGIIAASAALLTLLRGAWVARKLLKRLDAKLVIGVGGYASVPTVVAAFTLRLPIALLEPNAHPGRSNRILSRVARNIFVQFEDAAQFFPSGRNLHLGYPVRQLPDIAEKSNGEKLRLLIAGGSQGARSINRAVTAHLEVLNSAAGFEITHQTGVADLDEVHQAYADAGVEANVEAFFDDLPRRLAEADLVIARSGAATVAELCMAGTPSILVPYPYAADDHQTANAKELERAGAALIIADAELQERLVTTITELTKDPARRRAMGEAAKNRARPDAAAKIWEHCRSWLKESQ